MYFAINVPDDGVAVVLALEEVWLVRLGRVGLLGAERVAPEVSPATGEDATPDADKAAVSADTTGAVDFEAAGTAVPVGG